MRYRLLEPVRQYAALRLAETDELETARVRMAAFCIALAEQAEPELQGPHQAEWLDRLDGELENVRAVLGHAEKTDDSATILRLAGALNYFFWMRRHLREAHHWYTVGLKNADSVAPPLRARGLYGLTLMLSLVGDNAQAGVVGRDAFQLFREPGDSARHCWVSSWRRQRLRKATFPPLADWSTRQSAMVGYPAPAGAWRTRWCFWVRFSSVRRTRPAP